MLLSPLGLSAALGAGSRMVNYVLFLDSKPSVTLRKAPQQGSPLSKEGASLRSRGGRSLAALGGRKDEGGAGSCDGSGRLAGSELGREGQEPRGARQAC